MLLLQKKSDSVASGFHDRKSIHLQRSLGNVFPGYPVFTENFIRPEKGECLWGHKVQKETVDFLTGLYYHEYMTEHLFCIGDANVDYGG